MLDKYIVLNNGVKIPQFGLGTFCLRCHYKTQRGILLAKIKK